MDLEFTIGKMVMGALGGRKKRSRGAARFLTGGKGSFLNGSTLLALGGLAWGVVETLGQQKGGQTQAAPGGFAPAGRAPLPASMLPPLPGAGPVVPPPLPGAPSAPPAPAGSPASSGPAAVTTVPPIPEGANIPEGAARIVRLMISVATADGSLTPDEREAILTQARTAGLEALAAGEIDRPTPLEAIVGGIADEAQRRDLYTLAFSIVRADEQVTGAERIYLTRLASMLGLDASAVAALEQKAAERIDADDES